MNGTVPLFASDDVDAMSELMNGYLEPGSVRLRTPPKSTGGLWLSQVAGAPDPTARSGVSIYRLNIEREIHMRATELSDAYTIGITLAGRNDLVLDNEPVGPSHMLCSPGTRVSAVYARSRQLLVRIGQSAVDQAVLARTAEMPRRPVRFDIALRADQPDVAAWLRLVSAFADRSMSGLLDSSPLAAGHFQQMLVHGLLDVQANSLTPALAHDRGSLTTQALRQAVEFCERNADRPITVADMAAAAHTTVRTLQRAFRAEFDMSPLDYLRRRRLRHARADLAAIRAGHATGTVTEVALRWGFTHLGRFSLLYRTTYGESPSETVTA
ncbi:helix-turn-helix transcriptional regulator [Kibdelosporangium phytohabitans]|uniref:HTH araC/xylS-type domain-containing protein n=1 Tax=Kibdelosporangium phytohabitans TaxID=860235 RepID=A0A0N9I4Z2_9PSEU|nr:AraC family transcriptional regulator [Kibdelosporangium phytohabitans]ALG10952.1 hypothetical protein AOZ06_32325 [Kibdelosporangium phytohabitans]MBE1462152.1 AraC-like DNA-binding protein [Kibdelosporangium phytohabitans]